MTRVLLVDDHPTVREGLGLILSATVDVELVGKVGSLDAARRQLGISDPDLVVLDLRLPGPELAGACAELARPGLGPKVLVLTDAVDETTMIGVFLAGARGYLLRRSEHELLRVAVRFIASNGVFLDPRAAPTLVEMAIRSTRPHGPHGLTAQELRILRMLPRGLTNREIAGQLHVSRETVKTHVRAIFRKLEVSDRVQAARIAVREGLV